MRPVTPRFLEAIAFSHRVAVQVDVLLGGEAILEDIAVAGGTVTFDRNAAVLARLSIELAEPARLPTSESSLLTPYGFELRVSRGIEYSDGTRELVGLGVFPIQSTSVDGVTLLSSITALDRSQRVRDARLEDDYQIPAGTNYATAIRDLIDAGVPALEYAFASTVHITPLLTFAAMDDRWDHAQKMARSIGYEVYFDGLGRCVLRAEPDLRTAVPVWTIAEGDGGVLTAASIELDRAPAYNAVVATGENASLSSVPRGVARDEDPVSPTYYYGPFGRKPRGYASPFIASDLQATSAAQAILAGNLGVARSVDFSAVPNPALEAGDPVRIVRTALSLDETHIIDTLSIGLGPAGGMSCGSRARQEGSG